MSTELYHTHPRFRNNFDFLRLFTAVYVVMLHSYGLTGQLDNEPLRSWGSTTFNFSFVRLSLFFCISGYLVMQSAMRSTGLGDFAWRRLLRIQPLLIVVTLVSIFIIGPLFSSLDIATYFKQLQTWTHLRNIFPPTGIQYNLPGVFQANSVETSVNGSLWTLVIEERLYIACMIIFFAGSTGKRKAYIFLAIAYNLIYIINTNLWHFSDSIIINGNAAFYSLMFVNAGLLFHLNIDFQSHKKIIWLPLLLLLTLAAAHFKNCFFLLIFIVPCLVMEIAFSRSFLNRTARFGDFSYGIFLFSFPVQQSVISLTNGNITPIPLFAITILITLPLAVLSWHFLEKKMLSLKHRPWFKKIPPPSTSSEPRH
ncbi:acyltransferase [Terrimonas sp. NA20]|uniref:Acyltransferase n=1 Tax=Terrimonas ginsenosidimutans TaxID=2908004 RepID=A0ABS9KY51_9BACT|nr:acyltransferase [Terrimonas ginsenosidimutans]MCG2617271.1 acyltransferase [Terrimonas ginsenosidimutans]